jgi:hypothetical protein
MLLLPGSTTCMLIDVHLWGFRFMHAWCLLDSAHAVFLNAFALLLKLWRFNHPPLEHGVGDVPTVGSQLTPEYLLSVRNFAPSLFWKRPQGSEQEETLSSGYFIICTTHIFGLISQIESLVSTT